MFSPSTIKRSLDIANFRDVEMKLAFVGLGASVPTRRLGRCPSRDSSHLPVRASLMISLRREIRAPAMGRRRHPVRARSRSSTRHGGRLLATWARMGPSRRLNAAPEEFKSHSFTGAPAFRRVFARRSRQRRARRSMCTEQARRGCAGCGVRSNQMHCLSRQWQEGRGGRCVSG